MSLLVWNDTYYSLLHKHKRHTGSYDNFFKLRCTKEDFYLNSSDAIWLLTFSEDMIIPALREHAFAIAHESNLGLLSQPTVLSESAMKCWLCDKPSHQETAHLKLILLPNLVNGFKFATESYHICTKQHGKDDPTAYLSELTFPAGLRAFYKPHQKLDHKHIVVTNGIPISKNFNEIPLSHNVEPQEDYVIVGDINCPIGSA
nr:movement protein [wheat yellows virus]WBU98230.1 movement protein [wheat yellows virus]WBU98237.1 movement protein [wheat yellows virus]